MNLPPLPTNFPPCLKGGGSGDGRGSSLLCTVGLQEILKAMYRFVELRAVSSYLIAVVAIMKRYRDRHLQLSSTAFCELESLLVDF